jgi:hypothetical protein
MWALGLNSASRFRLLAQIFSNMDFDSAVSNSNKTKGLSNIEMLWTAQDGGTGAEEAN